MCSRPRVDQRLRGAIGARLRANKHTTAVILATGMGVRRGALGRTMPIHSTLLADLVWPEILDIRQLARVRDQIYPAVVRRWGRVPTSNKEERFARQ